MLLSILSRLSMSIVPNVIRSSPCRWGVLFPSEKLLIYVVYVVVNSFPATRLSRYHSPKLPSSYRVDSILFWFDPLACANVLYIEFFSLVAGFSMLAISAKTAQMYPKSHSSKFAKFAICAHVFQKLLLFIINDLSSKAPRPTDFLRTHFLTPSKSPWLLVLLAYPLTLS